MTRRISTLLIITLIITSLQAQSRNPRYEKYIKEYAELAVKCQKEYQIPASITLAQGILESNAGDSELAKKCNNHFGIKCGSSWYGRTIHKDDDTYGECFRCYNNAKASYDDHAKFLKRQRYAFLYDYPITDYASWAYGLKKAGYATDPKYPQKLINIIETYELYKYDKGVIPSSGKPEDNNQLFGYELIKNNGVKCYKLMGDDTFKNISKETGLFVKELLYFNDLPKNTPLSRGEYVYLAPKKNKVSRKMPKTHVVQSGESMHSISQEYGIKLKALYKRNKIKYGTPAEVDQILKLR